MWPVSMAQSTSPKKLVITKRKLRPNPKQNRNPQLSSNQHSSSKLTQDQTLMTSLVNYFSIMKSQNSRLNMSRRNSQVHLKNKQNTLLPVKLIISYSSQSSVRCVALLCRSMRCLIMPLRTLSTSRSQRTNTLWAWLKSNSFLKMKNQKSKIQPLRLED